MGFCKCIHQSPFRRDVSFNDKNNRPIHAIKVACKECGKLIAFRAHRSGNHA